MRFKVLFISFLSMLTLATSCIKEEGLDKEADILSMTIEDDGFITSIVNEMTREVTIIMGGNIEKYKNGVIVPEIKTSPRSTVSPASFEPVTLNNYRHPYTVRAEDGGLKSYNLILSTYKPLIQDFEHWNLIYPGTGKEFWAPADPLWDCGNSGIRILYSENTPFPTRWINDGRPGSEGERSLFLETKYGKRNNELDIMDIPIFSGSMFRGLFETNMGDPLLSTKFGQPHPSYLGKPIALTAWYKYKAGSPYVSWEYNGKKKQVTEDSNKKDTFDLYAVLFKVSKNKEGANFYLSGKNINKFEIDEIVAYTPLENPGEKSEWFEYTAKFTHKEELNYELYNYKLAVVLASSSQGANYMGAVGSTLIVDDLRVVFENDSDAHLFK